MNIALRNIIAYNYEMLIATLNFIIKYHVHLSYFNDIVLE